MKLFLVACKVVIGTYFVFRVSQSGRTAAANCLAAALLPFYVTMYVYCVQCMLFPASVYDCLRVILSMGMVIRVLTSIY